METIGPVGLIVLTYAITFLESVVQMKAWSALMSKQRRATARWDAIYDLVLFADVYLVFHQWWLIFPVVVASYHGSYCAFPTRSQKDDGS